MINKIHNEDCIDTLYKLPNDFINLTITSPPYNVDLGTQKIKVPMMYTMIINLTKNT
jgi:DNA modification methylase